jgi:hypothetical protein
MLNMQGVVFIHRITPAKPILEIVCDNHIFWDVVYIYLTADIGYSNIEFLDPLFIGKAINIIFDRFY